MENWTDVPFSAVRSELRQCQMMAKHPGPHHPRRGPVPEPKEGELERGRSFQNSSWGSQQRNLGGRRSSGTSCRPIRSQGTDMGTWLMQPIEKPPSAAMVKEAARNPCLTLALAG